jgi:phage tail sheath protein FI
MAVYKRPGVYISEAVLPDTVPVEDTATLSSLLGTLEKGPVTSTTLVNSWSEFVRNFGNLSPTYPTTFAAYHFFLNGGQNLLVNRLVSASAVAASRTLMDKAGTPLATLRVDAANPGTWGNDIYVAISDNTADAARFDLIVYYGGSTPDKVVEQYVGCSMDPMDPKYVVPFVSQPSRYVVLTNLNSATAAPTNRPAVLAVGANSRLGSGTGTTVAGTAGAGLTATEYDTALARYDTVPFSIDVNAPALTDTALLAKIINYAHKRGDMFVVVDPAANQDATTVTGTYGAGLVAAVKALPDTASGSSHAAIYAPWATIPDPLSVVPGQTRTIAPGGGILGLYARTDAVDGPEKAPAGVRATLRGVVAPERAFTASDLDTLNSAAVPVNAIRSVPGAGICVMGAKTILPGGADKYVNVRRALIYLRTEMKYLLQFAAFENNDPDLWSQMTNTLRGFLTQFWQTGGLKGNAPQDAFWITCDASNNTAATIQNGEVHADIGVALQRPAEFVVVSLTQITGA